MIQAGRSTQARRPERVVIWSTVTSWAGHQIGLLRSKTAELVCFEDYDPKVAAERDYGFVRLNQLALEHILGVAK